jgi:hypothetical protein
MKLIYDFLRRLLWSHGSKGNLLRLSAGTLFLPCSDLDLLTLWTQALYGINNLIDLDNSTLPEQPSLQTAIPLGWNQHSSTTTRVVDLLFNHDW